jgi:hypothetical protein
VTLSRIEAGPGAGEVYQYKGEDLTEALDLRLVDYQTENWQIANLLDRQPGGDPGVSGEHQC